MHTDKYVTLEVNGQDLRVFVCVSHFKSMSSGATAGDENIETVAPAKRPEHGVGKQTAQMFVDGDQFTCRGGVHTSADMVFLVLPSDLQRMLSSVAVRHGMK